MIINVHIERLILEGLPVTSPQGPQVQRALERELETLLASNGLSRELRQGTAIPSVRGGTIEVPNESWPAMLGQRIARAVYGGIGESAGACTARRRNPRGSPAR
jgi:hypothetical protein